MLEPRELLDVGENQMRTVWQENCHGLVLEQINRHESATGANGTVGGAGQRIANGVEPFKFALTEPAEQEMRREQDRA